MIAMIFAAGLGTRLKPFTDNCPKALVKVNNKALLEHNILKLKSFGYTAVVINIHHYGNMIREFVAENNNFGIDIYFSDESDLLLDTGGGLKKAQDVLSKFPNFLVHNVDIISDINFNQLSEFHINNNNLASLAVRERNSSRLLYFDDNNILTAWKNTKTDEVKIVSDISNSKAYAFSGISVLSSKIFPLITESGVFSIIDVYLRLAKNNKIACFNHSKDNWVDSGKPEDLELASKILNKI